MNQDAPYWIQYLDLKPHPEGGYFRETYRAEGNIPPEALPIYFNGPRSYATGIYFLLQNDDFSAFHRIGSDEMWHFYQGNGLEIFILDEEGSLEMIRLGNNPGAGEYFRLGCLPTAGLLPGWRSPTALPWQAAR